MKDALPSGWAEASFGTITVNHDGRRVPVKASDRAARQGGYRYFGAQGVIDYIDDYLFDGTYLLIAEDGANLVSRAQPIAEIATGQFWVNNHAHVVESVNGISLKFLKHFMNGNSLNGAIRGTAQPKLTQADLNRLCVPVPPTAEQKRITLAIEEQFSRLDAGIAVLERARQNIKRMRAAIFESAVTGWIGEGFPQIRLGDVLREPLRNGHSAKADPLGTIPILTLTAVTLGDFGTHNIKMTAADPRRVRDLWIQPGDLLIERSNTRELVGTASLYRGRPNLAVYPDLVIRARVDGTVVPEYAELVLKAPRSRLYFQQRAQGISGTMPKIDQQAIEDLMFMLPPPEMQAAIVQEAERKLTLLESLQGNLELVAKRSSALRSSILTAAFSGQLVPQDPEDEPTSILLERITAAHAASNGHQPTRTTPKRRAPREKVKS